MRKRREYVLAQKTGVRVTTPHFVLLLARGASLDAAARIGITASKQVGNAVARNRTKRIVRAAFRENPAFFPAGVDVVVIARTGADSLRTQDVVAEWTKVASLVRRKAEEVRRRARTSLEPADKGGAPRPLASHSGRDEPKR